MCPKNGSPFETGEYLPSGSFRAYMKRWFEAWRKETIPERDGLLGETEGDNIAHVIVRGAFLDYFFGDERIQAAIEDGLIERPSRTESSKRQALSHRWVPLFSGIRMRSLGMMRFLTRRCKRLTPPFVHSWRR